MPWKTKIASFVVSPARGDWQCDRELFAESVSGELS